MLFEAALTSPANLGEAKHLLANQSDVCYWLGVATENIEGLAAAREWWERAARQTSDLLEMTAKPFSEMTYYTALALKRLNRITQAEDLLRSLLTYAEDLATRPAKIEYFATSLPDMLLFDDDLQKRQLITGTFLQAQAWLGLGGTEIATRLVQKVLQLDANHALAGDFLADIEEHRDHRHYGNGGR